MQPYIKRAEKDLQKFNLNLDFKSIDDLYIETRKEAIQNTMPFKT